MNRYQLFIFLLPLLFLMSCEEYIDLDLQAGDSQLVVEALVTDGPGPHKVSLSRTVPVDNTQLPPKVTGATVVLSDDAGNSEVLTEGEDGDYLAYTIAGVEGRKYRLEIDFEGETYVAESILPGSGTLDSMSYQYFDKAIFVPDTGYYVSFYGQTVAGANHFYMGRLFVNDTLYEDDTFPFLLFDSRFTGGNYINGWIVPYRVSRGDSVLLEFSSITSEAYDFNLSVLQQAGAGNPFGAPPANLKGNFSNGALGFFRTSTVLYGEVVVE
jgi:hypothetical protein